MLLLMPCDPMNPSKPDEDFESQHRSAIQAGLHVALYDHDELVSGSPMRATRRLRGLQGPALVRGWMLKPDQYESLWNACSQRNVTLVTTPGQYVWAHHLPNWYSSFRDLTMESIWLDGSQPEVDQCLHLLSELDCTAAIVKDFVKSWKHEWLEACFIPDTRDHEHCRSVISRFLELQGDDLNGGVVLRAFVELESIGQHSTSGMPLSVETRVFALQGEALQSIDYWPGMKSDTQPPEALVRTAISRLQTPFATLDFAKTCSGQWMLVEVGDGQVSGLQGSRPDAFYLALAQRLV